MSERPEPRKKILPGGEKVLEPEDGQFIFSNAGTVHKRAPADREDYDYEYHPKCGTRLPEGSLWGSVDAESEAEAVLKYDLVPCTSCFENVIELREQRRKRHSALAMDHTEKKTYPFDEDE